MQKSLGSLEEQKLLAGGYAFPELAKVTEAERSILLDSAAALFLEHKVCFRETDLLGNAYLVFPELINLSLLSRDSGIDGVLHDAARLRIAHSFNRVGIAPRFIFQISNFKYEILNRSSAARWARG